MSNTCRDSGQTAFHAAAVQTGGPHNCMLTKPPSLAVHTGTPEQLPCCQMQNHPLKVQMECNQESGPKKQIHSNVCTVKSSTQVSTSEANYVRLLCMQVWELGLLLSLIC